MGIVMPTDIVYLFRGTHKPMGVFARVYLVPVLRRVLAKLSVVHVLYTLFSSVRVKTINTVSRVQSDTKHNSYVCC